MSGGMPSERKSAPWRGRGRLSWTTRSIRCTSAAGTPSLLGAQAMEGLLTVIGEERLRHSELEWTAEANPESFTQEVAKGWRCAGVNRISLGIQSFHAPTLQWMGRLHGADGARSAVQVARAEGFANLSVDLIFGLPAHLERNWERDLDETLSLEPDHVSLYGLSAESATPLGRAVVEGRETLPLRAAVTSRSTSWPWISWRKRGTRRMRFPTLLARDSPRGHNSVYWSGEPYIGLGNGGAQLPASAPQMESSGLGRLPGWHRGPGARRWTTTRKLDVGKVRLERIWLGLRTRRGISLRDLPSSARDRAARWEKSAFGGGGRGCRATHAKGMAGNGPPNRRTGRRSRRVIATEAVSRYF